MRRISSWEADLDIQKLLRTEIRELRHRHEVEISLVHALYAMKSHGPADGQPSKVEQIRLVAESSLFNPQRYLESLPRATLNGMSAAEHYVCIGAFEGLDPGPDFDTMAYYLANPQVAKGGWPALVHYLHHEKGEGRPFTHRDAR